MWETLWIEIFYSLCAHLLVDGNRRDDRSENFQEQDNKPSHVSFPKKS